MLLKLLEKKQETPDVKTFVIEAPVEMTWKAGQYMRYQIPNEAPDEKGIMRYFTNAAAPFEGHLQITTRYADPISTFKQDLDKLSPGAEIITTGPFGGFTLEDPIGEYVFIAGGIGITPFRSMLLQLDHDQKPFTITLLYGNRTEDAVFRHEFEEIAQRNSGLKVEYAIGSQFIDEAFISEKVPNFSARTFYISGPEPMVKGIEATLAKMGVEEVKIHKDYFPGYDGI